MNSEEMLDLLKMEYSKGRYDTINKAIEWLDEHLLDYWGQQNSDPSNFFIDFKKAMEGGTAMKPTIEIKLGRERHRLVPCEGNGCAACSLYTMCYVMKACGRQLCDAAYLETTEWKDNQNHRFELLTK